MQIRTVSDPARRTKADALVIPFWEGGKAAAKNVPSCKGIAAIKLGDFRGKREESVVTYGLKQAEPRLVLVGLGKPEQLDRYGLQNSFAAVAKLCRKHSLTSLSLYLPEIKGWDTENILRAATEGLLLADYTFDDLKTGKPPSHLKKLQWLALPTKMNALLKQTLVVHEKASQARDLINGNSDDVTPEHIVQVVKQWAQENTKLKATIFDKKRLQREGFHLLLAVNQGSAREPAFIQLEYKGDPRSPEHTIVVGKGITYDTGGLSLKPSTGMETMRTDMAAAAAVLASVYAAASLGLKLNVTALVPSTENMIGSRSYRVGDVYRSYAGKTVEIGNTDAEGRLALADALAYASAKLKPSRIIDLATLTGATVIALGEEVAGVMANNDQLAKLLVDCGEATSEHLWHMPLPQSYRKRLDSKIADLRNVSSRAGSGLTAGLFLQEFVGENIPWAHLDIAGVGYTDQPLGSHSQRATGFGVRLLVELFERLATR